MHANVDAKALSSVILPSAVERIEDSDLTNRLALAHLVTVVRV